MKPSALASEKILIIKHGAFGDIVQADGVLRDIRAQHPHAEATLLTTPPFRKLMSRCPHIDHIITDARPPFWNIGEWLTLASKLRVERFTQVSESLAESVRGIRVETLEQGRPEMRTTLDRAALFLRLVALLAALMSAVAVAMVSRDFAQRRLDDCALLRVMGVSQSVMARTYLLEFLLVGVFASALGLLVGWGFHLVFVSMLAELVGVSLPPAGWQPVALGRGGGVLLTWGFGLPPVLQLAKVPRLRVLRRDLGGLRPLSGGVAALGSMALLGLLMAVARDIKLGGIALGGFVAAVALFAVLAMLMVLAWRAFIRRMGARVPTWLALASRQLTAQPGQTVVQVCALGVGLLALMLLVLI